VDLVYSNSAISAHMVKHMLNQARIGAMLRAESNALVNTVLAEIGYLDCTHTIDQIIEDARKKAFDMFASHCTDPAIRTCVTAMYDHTQTVANLKTAEDKLFAIITANLPKIKHPEIKRYFQTMLDANPSQKKATSSALWNIARGMKTDIEGLGFIFYWYVMKQGELIAVKTILVGKQLGQSRDKIMENLGVLYDRF